MSKKYFNSIGEMAQAIYDGKEVRNSEGYSLTYDDKCAFRNGDNVMLHTWTHWQECYELVDWKESVSKENPKLCYVSDVSEKDAVDNKSSVRLINDFISDHKYAFKLNAMSWKYAVPVPKEEVLKWLVDNEE